MFWARFGAQLAIDIGVEDVVVHSDDSVSFICDEQEGEAVVEKLQVCHALLHVHHQHTLVGCVVPHRLAFCAAVCTR